MTDSPFPLSDDDIANFKAEFMASDPAVTFVVDDEPAPAEGDDDDDDLTGPWV